MENKISRGYYWLNKAWYGNERTDDEILFGLYYENGGTCYKMENNGRPMHPSTASL